MEALVDGSARDATPVESALIRLARRSCEAPNELCPADLEPLRQLVGDDADDYVTVLLAFHFVNRIADLLGLKTELLPSGLRRFELVRKASVRLMGMFMSKMDLSPRSYDASFAQARAALQAILPRADDALCGRFAARPQILEVLQLVAEARSQTGLTDSQITQIEDGVEAALGSTSTNIPREPFEAFIWIGTRQAWRSTAARVAALRAAGYDDRAILDVSIAIAEANQWARAWRLWGLPADLLRSASVPVEGDGGQA